MVETAMMDEPSVFDYVKSRLMPWKYPRVEIPPPEAEAEPPARVEPAGRAPEAALEGVGAAGQPPEPAPYSWAPATETGEAPPQALPVADQAPAEAVPAVWPWRALLALALALVAQFALEPHPGRSWMLSAVLYGLAAGLLVWAQLGGEWKTAPLPRDERLPDLLQVRSTPLMLGLILALAAFAAFGGNLFTPLNLTLWGLAIALCLRALWLDHPGQPAWDLRLERLLRRSAWTFHISRRRLALLAVVALIIFFRTYQLEGVPPEMNSDHAEKLLDVLDVLNGQTRIFFPRNTGREFFQFYLTAAVAQLFGTGLSFLSLKIGTVLAGFMALFYIYKLGKEIANAEVALWALAFAGIAFWPNIISRIALRFALYPLFAAPMLYYLLRGLRRSDRTDFILAGIALGLGLHGYSSARILPFVVVVAVALYLLHRQSQGVRRETVLRLGLLAFFALLLFLPLLRFAVENPEAFAYRAFTRLSDWERPLPGPAWQIFLQNLWNAWVMFFWDDGEVWLHSVPHRPALSAVAAALYFIGSVTLLVRYIRRRHWLDLFLLLSVPLLMLPSILSLAFPGENPSLNRTSAAVIPVFLITGLGVHALTKTIRRGLGERSGRPLAWGLAGLLLVFSAAQDYDLVFNQYRTEYARNAWNSSEMGQVIHDFAATAGTLDSAWVIPFPHWVDTRLVGFIAGYPGHDYAVFPDQLEFTTEVSGPKLFLLKPEDEEGLLALRRVYPNGWVKVYDAQVENKDFLMYFVPPR
jgi:4-amino-4-deoxy-L-arabinose transferase-like glycosyltransferase